ncbi:hypothetical protein GIB67_032891 [Kingdonia uniflora]|uniref:Uncharacterized protein n=1 Tax=Kingdonia uniflora TaxID=39325 RepID=A0A7J7KV21_9MAGN|nr:hypothetical protein GIB67_032891 [Kingdonia uniflora]
MAFASVSMIVFVCLLPLAHWMPSRTATASPSSAEVNLQDKTWVESEIGGDIRTVGAGMVNAAPQTELLEHQTVYGVVSLWRSK